MRTPPAPYDNEKHWQTEDGRLFLSVPTTEPAAWKRKYRQDGKLIYTSGDYTIVRHKADGPYNVYRDGVELPLSFTGLLKIAKERAVKNARGEDRMHVA